MASKVGLEKDWESGSSIDSVRDQIICRRMFADIDEESSAGDEASSNSDDNQLSSDLQMKRFVTFRKKKSEKSLLEFAEKKSCPSSSNRARKYWWSFRFKKRLKNRLRKTNGSKSTPCDLSSADSEISLEAGCMSTCMGVKKADEQVSNSVIWFSGPSSDINDSRSSGDDSPVHTPKVKVKGRSKKSKHRAKDKSSRQMKKLPTDDLNEHLCTACANDSVVEIPPNIPYHSALATGGRESLPSISGNAFQKQCIVTTYPSNGSPLHGAAYSSESQISEYGSLTPQGTYIPHTVHTQVDYVHCLVPDLCKISSCTFYWGVMDRYEAEKLLENKPEGTFLLRDSAQEEFLFSVSFRRYARSLHARIEQWNHKFSFDSHDPGVFSSDTVCELIEHYKDPSCCMFFEPMLTLPMNRTFPFPLQHLCRAVIGSHITYDGINFLPLPKKLKEYLRYYHYKQKVRVRRFEVRQ